MLEFEEMVSQSRFHLLFEDITKIPSNRVMDEHLTMVHKSSRIQCTVCFQVGPPSTVVRDIVVSEFICKLKLQFFTLRRTW